MKSATASPASARELKASAVQRLLARRTDPDFDTYAGPHGPVRIQTTVAELKTPASLAEWCDRTIANTPVDAVGSALIVILEAARTGGARNAAATVAVAERLTEWNQWFLWKSLSWLSSGIPDVSAVKAEVDREWRRLKLASAVPRTPLIVEKDRPKFDSEGPGSAYSPSVPDEMKVRR
jgi:hypothetical protein